MVTKSFLLSLSFFFCSLFSEVSLGVDQLFKSQNHELLRSKKIGLITNLSSKTSEGQTTLECFYSQQSRLGYELAAIFSPEHGLDAKKEAFAFIHNDSFEKLPVYSLHGQTKRPTPEMLKGIDILIYDMQTVGLRCYTYETTLFYAMEEAAKNGIEVWVLDRPNPIGGQVIEGEVLKNQYKCFFGYVEVPFRHGMTIAELALFFKNSKALDLKLKVIPMKGWSREMTYQDTGLSWQATSPNIPDGMTPLTYPATIVLGETLEIVSIDRGGDKPFKRVGAPWIDADHWLRELNKNPLIGVKFESAVFIPKSEKYKGLECKGLEISITDPKNYKALELQNALIASLLELYPDQFQRELEKAETKKRGRACNYLTGSETLFSAIKDPAHFREKSVLIDEKSLQNFLEKRSKILLY